MQVMLSQVLNFYWNFLVMNFRTSQSEHLSGILTISWKFRVNSPKVSYYSFGEFTLKIQILVGHLEFQSNLAQASVFLRRLGKITLKLQMVP